MNTMIRFSPCIKVLAIVLSVLIVLLGLPLSVFAEDLQALFVDETDGNSAPAIDVTAEASEHSFEPFEETSLRSDSTKTFRLPDGSHYLAQYTTDVHTPDADGNYQDIDNSLKLTDGVFSTPDERFSLAGKAEKNVTLLRRSFGNASLSFAIKNARSAAGAVEKNTVCLPEDASVLDRLTTLPDITSAVLYEDVWKNADLRYVLSGNDVREYIIINARAESYEYAFAITAEGLAAKTEDSGEIVFTDAETGEFVCRIPAPVMWDAERNVPEKINTVITEETGENGATVLLVTYTADAVWMNAPERKFPVTLDPPVIANRSTGVTDLDILTSNPTRSSPTDSSIYVSSDWRAYWKINTLPAIPFLARITDATVAFQTIDNGGSGYLGVFEVLTDWDSTLTWGDVTRTSAPEGKPATVCTDYRCHNQLFRL